VSELLLGKSKLLNYIKLYLNIHHYHIIYLYFFQFGQRDNLPVTEYFTKNEDYQSRVHTPGVILQDLPSFFNDGQLAYLTYTMEDENIEGAPNTSPVIAAFTTAQARLKLYSYIEKLQERVLYFDTDSLIYMTGPLDT
jgi:hypothetical protein